MRNKNVLLSLAIFSILVSACKDRDLETVQTEPSQSVDEVPTQTQQIQQTNQILTEKRAAYSQLFNEAYQQYTLIPKGTLESLAFVASRWEHRMPDHEQHSGMPQTHGLFGLYDSDAEGFTNTLQLVADNYGVTKQQLIDDIKTYVLATAAFIEYQLINNNIQSKSIESIRPVLAILSGIDSRTDIEHYAINSFIYDALNALEKGHDDNGIHIEHQRIQWNKAFNESELKLLRAPGLKINYETGKIDLTNEIYSYDVPSSSSTNQFKQNNSSGVLSTDYEPALWNASPNFSNRNSSITHVVIHTMQGSYSGSINWFKSSSSNASAHYMVRSSDGQVTQMVRDSKKAWHARSANKYSIGIEHEGYVSNPAWYTEAMYASSADITLNMCINYNIDCSNAYEGDASSSVEELPQAFTVKGHQHYPDQSHSDPGVNWQWQKYYDLVNGIETVTTIIDDFETNEGHFNLYPTYSGSTKGISSLSTAVRTSSFSKEGIGSEEIRLRDKTNTSQNWLVRFLSGSGNPSNNTQLTVKNGKVGFWIRSGGSGLSAYIGIDDGSGTEISIEKTIPVNQWTFLEWHLDDSEQWNEWVGSSNGQIDSEQVTIDAIWLKHLNTSYDIYVNIDDVQHTLN